MKVKLETVPGINWDVVQGAKHDVSAHQYVSIQFIGGLQVKLVICT